jgi:hypothetical protein
MDARQGTGSGISTPDRYAGSDADAQAVIQMPAGLSEKMNNLCFDIPAKKW